MDGFWVDHGEYGDVNMGLHQQVGNINGVIEDLNQTLRHIDVATGGQATPLWEEHQSQWNGSYTGMRDQLHGHTRSSFNVADTFQEGDKQGARIMG